VVNQLLITLGTALDGSWLVDLDRRSFIWFHCSDVKFSVVPKNQLAFLTRNRTARIGLRVPQAAPKFTKPNREAFCAVQTPFEVIANSKPRGFDKRFPVLM
jgi:hypothetical protein